MNEVKFVEVAADTWARPFRLVRRLAGGMNGVTLELDDAGERRVLKWVPERDRSSLVRGAVAAQEVAVRGIRSGEPIATLTGELTVSALGGELMLMNFLAGDELTGTDEDHQAMAGVLTRIHTATESEPAGDFYYAAWLRAATHEPLPRWVARALRCVLSEYDALPPTRWCIINGDPSPDEFRRTDDTIGLLDWGSAVRGPALYDVATLYMYLGGTPRGDRFLDAYRAANPRSAQEAAHLAAFMRFRGAIQAVYFARRINAGDLTGASHADNETGLTNARSLLRLWGIE